MVFDPGFFYGLFKDGVAWAVKYTKKIPPEEVIRKRFEKKKELEKNRDILVGRDLLIRDIRRIDSYPDNEMKKKLISSWFRVEYKSLYHKGVEIFIGVESIKIDREKKKWGICSCDDPDSVTSFVVGKIPFEAIVEIDWYGDEYCPIAHFYCDFNKNKMPYDEVVYVVSKKIGGKEFFHEVGSYDAIHGDSNTNVFTAMMGLFRRIIGR